MGAVPLLTREGEVDLARRMERGKVRMQKAISRSALVQLAANELAETLKKTPEELDNMVDIGGEVEEGSPADIKRRTEVRQLFQDIQTAHKKLVSAIEKFDAAPTANKKGRRRAQMKVRRALVETSLAIRKVPWMATRWREFTREIEREIGRAHV